MIEAIKTIKNAPMKQNLADIFKSAFYLVASLVAFTIKLTIAIIASVYTAGKVLATSFSK